MKLKLILLSIVLLVSILIFGNSKRNQVHHKTIGTRVSWYENQDNTIYSEIKISSVEEVFPCRVTFPYSLKTEELEVELDVTVAKGSVDLWIEDRSGTKKKITVREDKPSTLKGTAKLEDFQEIKIYLKSHNSESSEGIMITLKPLLREELQLDSKMLNRYEMLCNKSDGSACAQLANLYLRDEEVPHDYQKSFEFFEKGCRLDNAISCHGLAWLYDQGIGVQKDSKKAYKTYLKSCNLGWNLGCTNVGSMLATGTGVEQDTHKAIGFYKKSCATDERKACELLTILERQEKEIESNKKDIENYTLMCKHNDIKMCLHLADIYYKGIGVEKNIEESTKILLKVCNMGEAEACNSLGWLLEEKNDLKNAHKFYTKSCDNNYTMACSNLGYLYENAIGVKRDIEKAKYLYKVACDDKKEIACSNLNQLHKKEKEIADAKLEVEREEKECTENNFKSCAYLGVRYFDGSGLFKEKKKAKKFFEKACNGKDIMSCSNLGLMYAMGEGVEVNREKALELLTKACPQIDKDKTTMTAMSICTNLQFVKNNNRGDYHWILRLNE